MKKIFLLIFVFLLISNLEVFAWNDTPSCDKPNLSIKSKIETCNAAVKPYLSKNWFISKWSSIRSIEDFVCLQDVPENRVIQIILDTEFTKIDCDMEKYFQSLTNSKNLYFWKWAKLTYFDWVNAIWEKSRYFNDLYINACSNSISQAWDYIKNSLYTLESEQSSVSIDSAKDFLYWSNWACEKLVGIKMEIFNNVAFNILQLNKAQVAKDQKKLYEQEQRTKYSKLADIMMINLSYIERIWQKWPSKIKNAL